MLQLYEEQQATDVKVSEMIEGADSSSAEEVIIREVAMMSGPLPSAPMCPKTTNITNTFRCSVKRIDDKVVQICLESSAISHDVPFGSNFQTQSRVVFTPEDGGVKCVNLGRVVFVKSCGWLKGAIQKGAINGMTEAAMKLVPILSALTTRDVVESVHSIATESRPKSEAKARSSTKSMKSKSASASFRLTIYELQRRLTLFQQDWRAPFLPHDRARPQGWRWLDTTFHKHPWTSAGSRQQARAAESPPIAPGTGWRQLGEWKVEAADGDEGWQYSTAYYKFDSSWKSDKSGCLCRRRKWTCEFVPTVA